MRNPDLEAATADHLASTGGACCVPTRSGPDTVGGGCAPPRGKSAPPVPATFATTSVEPSPTTGASSEMVQLPGGRFWMGNEDRDGYPADGEGPVRPVQLPPFGIAAHTVTNVEFAQFASATGYLTDAEQFGWSYVFAGLLPAELRRDARRPAATPWWCAVAGASWSAPRGPGSDIDTDHPVVHVSWRDAQAYCAWAGVRLPSEAEWEYAARGGLERARYPWGDEPEDETRYRANIFRGRFPARNTASDGYPGTAPVEAFEPNGFGLYQMVGNVWEWCADHWSTQHSPGLTVDPRGPASGESRVLRGGSYLCHDSYCNRYRVAARIHNSPDSSSGNTGFRVAA